jgi:hypothetical protein
MVEHYRGYLRLRPRYHVNLRTYLLQMALGLAVLDVDI